MPKFSKAERKAISEALLRQGERLFCEYGLRKVTIEEIARAAGIAKGSFYAFHGSKEELYFAILARCQQDMWARMDAFLDENTTLPPRALLKAAIRYVFAIIDEYPMIKRTDSETMVVLLRKLPDTVTGHHLEEDAQAVALFTKHMVKELQAAGKTVILTTHNMHDAAELCDRVAFIVDGEIRALDTPAAFARAGGKTEVTFGWRAAPSTKKPSPWRRWQPMKRLQRPWGRGKSPASTPRSPAWRIPSSPSPEGGCNENALGHQKRHPLSGAVWVLPHLRSADGALCAGA